jgi:hypothetical protein
MPHNIVIYAVEISSVGFTARIGGEVQKMIEFTQVFHVPDLHNSLLSVLYLTKYWGVGLESANFSLSIYTLPLNRDLWHR